MKQPTIRFQRTLIKLLRGMLTAWEEWVDDNDPSKHSPN